MDDPRYRVERRKRIPYKVRAEVMDRSDWKCVRCGSHREVQVDHIVPWSQGGSDDADNLQALCRKCNANKGPKPRVARERGERRVILAVRLSAQGIAALDEMAQDRGTTRSEALRTCLGAGMAALGFTPTQIKASLGEDGRKRISSSLRSDKKRAA